MCTIHNDPGTGSHRPRTPASGVPAVLTSVVAALLLFCVAPHGHAQTDSEPVLGTVTDQTFLDNQEVDTDLTNSVADPLVLPAATGGDGTLTYTLECAATQTDCDTTSKLPPGLVFTASSRTLSGSPDDVGHFDMNYKVEDADGDSDSTTFRITVLLVPVLSIDAPSVAEGGDGDTPKLTFTVTLEPASSDTVTVKYADAGTGTATSGTDYDAVAADTLTFASGVTSQTFEVTVTGDTAIELDETVVIKLSDATEALVGTVTAAGTIENDDYPVLSIDEPSVVEGGDDETATLTFTVTLTPASSDTVTVKYADAGTGAAASGTDYAAVTAGTLTFDPGDTEKTIPVTVNGDATDEPDETVDIKLSEPSNAQFAGGAATVEGTGTIENDDDPVMTIDDPWVAEGDSGTTTLVFNVRLSGASHETVAAGISDAGSGTATSSGADADYSWTTTGILNFASGITHRTVEVTVNGDTDDEPDETVVFTIDQVYHAVFPGGADELTGIGTIRNDDKLFEVGVEEKEEGDDGTTTFTFTVNLSAPAGESGVKVSYEDITATAGVSHPATSGDDYDAISDGQLEFSSGEDSKTIEVIVNADRDDESDEQIVLEFHSPENALFEEGAISERATALILNDDGSSPLARSLSIDSPSVTEGDDGTTTLTFTVERSGGTDSVVEVDYADARTGTATAGEDYVAISPGTLTFESGEASKTIEVTVKPDTAAELAETVVITLSNPYNAQFAGDATTVEGTGTITNDDAAVLTIEGSSVIEGDGEDGEVPASLEFTVRLSGPVADTVTVDYADAGAGTATSGEDYAAIVPATLTFQSGQTDIVLGLPVHGDTTVEPHETVVIALSNPTVAVFADGADTVTGTGTIRDDDGTPDPPADTSGTPAADAGADLTVDPEAPVALDGSGSSDPDDDTLTFAWSRASGVAVTLAGTDTAAPSFTAPWQPGDLVFRLTVTDPDGLAASDEVTVTVRDLAPGFGSAAVSSPALVVGQAMEAMGLPEATGGNGALTYSLTSVPAGLAGLSFEPATRRLSGTPTEEGSYVFTYRAEDADANQADSDAAVLTFGVTVEDPRTALLRKTMKRTLAAVARRALSSALENIGARFASSIPDSGLTLAGTTLRLGAARAPAMVGASDLTGQRAVASPGRTVTASAPGPMVVLRSGCEPGRGGRRVASHQRLLADAGCGRGVGPRRFIGSAVGGLGPG